MTNAEEPRSNQRGLKLGITAAAVVLILIRLIWPALKIDAITLGLALVAILPWLSTLIKSAEFPGGWEIEFHDLKSAGDKVTSGAPLSQKDASPAPTLSYVVVSEHDPNLALVGRRIEIEKRLMALANRYGIANTNSLQRLSTELQQQGVLDDKEAAGLRSLIDAGNRAAHGASVDPRAARWTMEQGPEILQVLDGKLRGGSARPTA